MFVFVLSCEIQIWLMTKSLSDTSVEVNSRFSFLLLLLFLIVLCPSFEILIWLMRNDYFDASFFD